MLHTHQQRPITFQHVISLAFISLCTLTVVLFIHIAMLWQPEPVVARQSEQMRELALPEAEEIADPSAPLGVRSAYTLTLPQIPSDCNTLAFYVIHHEVRITLDGELLYAMQRPPDAPYDTTGYSWVLLPVGYQDSGSVLRIELTPLFEAVRWPIHLLLGPHHAIYMDRLLAELPTIVFSVLAILIGGTYICFSSVIRLRRHTRNSLGYLGASSLFLGLFKLTDLQMAPLIFTGSAVALYYISLASLPLAAISMVFYVRGQYGRACPMPLNAACLLLLSLHCAQLLLQLLGVASLRETLPLCHLLLVLSGVVIIAALIHLQTQGLFGRRELLLGFSIGCCVLGLAIDLYRYYTVERPETLSFSLYAFLLLVLFSGFVSYHELSQRAQLDMQTDLYNKATCEEMLSGMSPADVPTGVIMFDLNGLKRVNDTWGHEAGDELIVSFARLLRANMPAGAFIGRYGGDEFVAILHHTSKAQLAATMESLRAAARRHNARSSGAPVSYAGGYLLSTDHPGQSMAALLSIADAFMYEQKRRQHAGESLS